MSMPTHLLDSLRSWIPAFVARPRLIGLPAAELALGATALLLPLTQSAGALSLAALGGVALLVVALWSNGTARTIAAATVIANAAFFWRLSEPGSLAVLWVDALALLGFLLAGGLVEAGVTSVPRRRWRAEGSRFLTGALCITVVLAATQFAAVPPWLVVAAMVAGLGALLLARDRPLP